jgi:predicted ABC-type ATPase
LSSSRPPREGLDLIESEERMSSLPPRITLVAGPNGAGKSTLAPFLLRDRLGIVDFVNADTIARGLSAFSPGSVAFAAGRIMLQRLRELAHRRASFAFESTLSTRSYAPWLRQRLGEGYEFELVFLSLETPDLAIERVRERVREGGHDISPDVVRRRHERGRENFLRLYSPLATRWSLFDNSSSELPTLVAAGAEAETLEVLRPDLWTAFAGGAK